MDEEHLCDWTYNVLVLTKTVKIFIPKVSSKCFYMSLCFKLDLRETLYA